LAIRPNCEVDDTAGACHDPRMSMSKEATKAIVELLFLTIYLDDRLSLPEDAVLERALTALGWRAGSNDAVDIAAAYKAASEAAACELRTDEFLRERAALLKAEGHSNVAFEWLGKLLGSDGLDAAEHRFMVRLQALLYA
jgi:hypothetical protein